MFKSLFFWKKNKSLSKVLKKNNRDSDFYFDEKTEKSIFSKSSNFFKSVIDNLFGSKDVNSAKREEIEEAFIKLDFGPFLSSKLAESITDKLPTRDIKDLIRQSLREVYGCDSTELRISKSKTNVFLIVGPNGVGKTTTIAKLAHRYKEGGFKILLVAGDTFRAGAVEQLKSWADRLQIDIFVPNKSKEDPSSLAYRVLDQNKDGNYDLIIFDTSGRQHSNQNLLKELNKMEKTIKRFDESYPNEVLFVIDSTTGQTGLSQAKSFLEHVQISGLILTKMDFLTKGGVLFLIKEQLKIPVKLIGTGESLSDLNDFSLDFLIDCWLSNLSMSENQ